MSETSENPLIWQLHASDEKLHGIDQQIDYLYDRLATHRSDYARIQQDALNAVASSVQKRWTNGSLSLLQALEVDSEFIWRSAGMNERYDAAHVATVIHEIKDGAPIVDFRSPTPKAGIITGQPSVYFSGRPTKPATVRLSMRSARLAELAINEILPVVVYEASELARQVYVGQTAVQQLIYKQGDEEPLNVARSTLVMQIAGSLESGGIELDYAKLRFELNKAGVVA